MRPGLQAPRERVTTADLLGRGEQVVYGPAARGLVRGRRVLVTGAGGSIGSEIVRQLHRLEPASVHLLDHDESSMHALQLELTGHGLLDDDRVVLADVRDRAGIDRVMRRVRPEIVFHAAAHKHLPLLERYPVEGVKTNVLGTLNVVAACVGAGVERFINISTDKAARPTSVLGATKRLAELVVSAHGGGATKVASVRFGNVLGSRGSFLHSLAHQVGEGQAVTVTDPDVTRFFMTIPEAAGLVIEAAVMADCGETYVLDMGSPVRILDLVERFVQLTGADSPLIRFTGLRPGEKLHEELLDDAEIRCGTGHPRIWVMTSTQQLPPRLVERVDDLYPLAADGAAELLMTRVRGLLPAGVDAGAVALPVQATSAPQASRGGSDQVPPDAIDRDATGRPAGLQLAGDRA